MSQPLIPFAGLPRMTNACVGTEGSPKTADPTTARSLSAALVVAVLFVSVGAFNTRAQAKHHAQAKAGPVRAISASDRAAHAFVAARANPLE